MNDRDLYVTRAESKEAVAVAALLGFVVGAITVAFCATVLAESVLWPR